MNYNPKSTGNQWYLPTTSKNLYNPRSKADITSRQSWYNNVLLTDHHNDIKFRRYVAIKKYPQMTAAEIELFLQVSPPEYH